MHLNCELSTVNIFIIIIIIIIIGLSFNTFLILNFKL